jgi:hypothetical protein
MTSLEYGAVADALDRAAVQKVQQETHDSLLAALGTTRRSGVRWYHYPANDAVAVRAIVMVDRDSDQEAAQGLLDFLDAHPAGLLIVAACDWEEGRG